MRSVNLDGSVVKTKAGCRNVGAAVSWQNEVKGIRLRQCRIDSSRADIAAVKSRDVDNVHGGLFYAQLFSLSVFQGERAHEQIEACPSIGWTWPSSGSCCRSSSPDVSKIKVKLLFRKFFNRNVLYNNFVDIYIYEKMIRRLNV